MVYSKENIKQFSSKATSLTDEEKDLLIDLIETGADKAYKDYLEESQSLIDYYKENPEEFESDFDNPDIKTPEDAIMSQKDWSEYYMKATKALTESNDISKMPPEEVSCIMNTINSAIYDASAAKDLEQVKELKGLRKKVTGSNDYLRSVTKKAISTVAITTALVIGGILLNKKLKSTSENKAKLEHAKSVFDKIARQKRIS